MPGKNLPEELTGKYYTRQSLIFAASQHARQWSVDCALGFDLLWQKLLAILP
jgi:hypothetical protein